MQFHYVETENISVDKNFNTVYNKFFGVEMEGSLRGGRRRRGEKEVGTHEIRLDGLDRFNIQKFVASIL